MTIDLKTAEISAPNREHYMTKATAVAPGGECPTWLKFLDRVTNGDRALVEYLQRVCGYCLTGSTQEHVMMFLYGTGANGKSVFVNTIAGMMDDYAVTSPVETFLASNSDRHPTELARLRGARLVIANETEEGRHWSESKLKALTGGDTITARFMHQDFFEFTPKFKLVIVGNHKPSLRNVDEAIRRRLHLIPFTVTIPAEERDHRLSEKLEAEWPGILQWAVEGCVLWQQHGLNPPAAVRDATDEYLAEEDAPALWFSECCVAAPDATESVADLYQSWKSWANAAGELPGTQKRFSQAMRLREGVRPKRQGGSGRAGFEGVRLIRADYTDNPRYGA